MKNTVSKTTIKVKNASLKDIETTLSQAINVYVTNELEQHPIRYVKKSVKKNFQTWSWLA